MVATICPISDTLTGTVTAMQNCRSKRNSRTLLSLLPEVRNNVIKDIRNRDRFQVDAGSSESLGYD